MDLNNLFNSSSFIKELSSKSKESQVKNRSKGGIDNLYNSVSFIQELSSIRDNNQVRKQDKESQVKYKLKKKEQIGKVRTALGLMPLETSLNPIEANLENEMNSIGYDSSIDLFSFNISETLLYPDSNIFLKEFFMIFIKFKTVNRLSDEISVLILKFIKAILPHPNNCPVSLNFIVKTLEIEHKAHHYQICETCNNLISEEVEYKQNISSKNCSGSKGCSMMSSFITFNISTQIEEILKKKNLLLQIKKSNSNSSSKEYIYEKKIDGSVYKEACCSKKNLVVSLTINSDGAPLCNSTKHNIWPVLATIVELEDTSREKFENMIVLGN
jgi:hypothetical protein